MEEMRACTGGRCQVWAYIPEGSTASLQGNSVTGAHINYLIEGLAIFGEFIDAKNISSAAALRLAGCPGRLRRPALGAVG